MMVLGLSLNLYAEGVPVDSAQAVSASLSVAPPAPPAPPTTTPKATRPNIAVIPFVGDKNMTPEQLNFITGKFSGELLATKAFTLLDRGKMDFILKEQGFQQSGACNSSECQVQMGQLLGVDNIVAGNIVKFGPEYAFRIDYIDVASGQIVQTVEVSKEGDLYQVYKFICSQGAQKLVNAVFGGAPVIEEPVATPAVVAPVTLPPETFASSLATPSQTAALAAAEPKVAPVPKVQKTSMSLKRKIAIALWGSALLGAGGGYYFDSKAVGYAKDYDLAFDAGNQKETEAAWDNLELAKTGRLAGKGVSIGAFVVGAILWFLPEGK
jgi:hypothetical protein